MNTLNIIIQLLGETSWCSGACFIIKRDVFEKVEGFDKKIFMYAEDVDLSWKVRLEGYKIKYVPKATLTHYCYKEANEIKPLQYYNSIINNLNLRLKYGNKKDVVRWLKYVYRIIKSEKVFKNSKLGLIKAALKNIKNMSYFILWKNKDNRKAKLKTFKPIFIYFDYECIREGAFIDNSTPIIKTPLVSILIRTCGRPTVLRETLISLRNQTYDNIEIVIVEDGKNISENMIKNEFADLNIVYEATGEKVGRCVAGNKAMQNASGDYFNFLDDDDLFFADHVETLLRAFQENDKYKIAYTSSFETKIDVIEKEPEYKYNFIGLALVHNKPFSRIRLMTMNMFPIQAIMFKREIFEQYGGMDESLDNLEDWEMWARYGMKNSFLFIPKTTSLYRVPAKIENYKTRQEEIDSYYKKAQNKILELDVNAKAKEILEEVNNI